jgi:hypothetical protein
MSYSVIDTPNNTASNLTRLKANGVTGIIRYNDRFSTWKQIKPAEARAIAAAGLELGLVYEHTATPSGDSLGYDDAAYCKAISASLGMPHGAGVYFAVDYDPSQSVVRNNILPYFRGIQRAFNGTGFRVGVYGSGLTCRLLKEAHLVELTWPTCSRGFTESRAYVASRAWDIWQVECDATLAGLDVDLNAVNTIHWGQFTPFGPPVPTPPPIPPPTPQPIHDNEWIQSSLNKLGAKPQLEVDGSMGPFTRAAIEQFQTANKLEVDGIAGPLTTAAIEAKLASVG